ncbi:periplasmic protein involved in polysaccharide export [Terriglobus roseus DSM 18391]|uniref:Periplasmic protein involved in polysaccharide export n=1 Tax=Terriglobus roseus (strain DSM 18391 / NRRL B-41598 / KBS 63) TaxID=926566 RepID=I3ZEU4_TERRK|nr:polysaccharide biosynthesis/export family protein [Terriglobus roseus]AFL87762.1 periplasmic protein involved in polysaccharide export [Terriglobus roseus DSM 18391]
MSLTRMLRLIQTAALTLTTCVALCLPAAAQYTGTVPTSAPGLNVRLPITTDPAVLYPPQRELTLLPGDLLKISVYGVAPEYTDTERVDLDGSIRMNLGGVIHVAGMSVKEAEVAMSERFESAEIFHSAQVSIELTEAPQHFATVVGEVKGTVPILGPKRLLEVMAANGGIPATASTVLRIDRLGQAEPIIVDIGNDPARTVQANVPIFTGDVITVGRVGQYYVLGAVMRPGVGQLSGSIPVTAVEAVSAAGGLTFPAKGDQATLIRNVGGQRTVINLQLRQIQDGKLADVVLQSDDILLVPSSGLKKFLATQSSGTVVALIVAMATLLR